MKILCSILLCSGFLLIPDLASHSQEVSSQLKNNHLANSKGQDTITHLRKNRMVIKGTDTFIVGTGNQYSPGSMIKFNSITSLFLYRKFYPMQAPNGLERQMAPASLITNKTLTDIDLKMKPYDKKQARMSEFNDGFFGSLLFGAFNKQTNASVIPYNASNPVKQEKVRK